MSTSTFSKDQTYWLLNLKSSFYLVNIDNENSAYGNPNMTKQMNSSFVYLTDSMLIQRYNFLITNYNNYFQK